MLCTRRSSISSAVLLHFGILFLCAFVGITCSGASLNIRCLVKERRALLEFRQSLVDESNALSSWSNEDDCCDWRGITCNVKTGHVVKIDLTWSTFNSTTEQRLSGTINASSLFEMRHLRYLDLSHHSFDGPEIPNSIGALSELKHLKLADSGFAGPIPYHIRNLSRLQTLDLSWNFDLTVNDLDWLPSLSALKDLDLSTLNLSEVVNWHQYLSKHPSLLELKLASCNLADIDPGSLPLISYSTSLQLLDLSGNNLISSPMLSWVLNLSTNFVVIDLGYNKFKGPIPDAFTKMVSLVSLDLSNNEFEGGIPKSFQHLCGLKWLNLQSNKLSDCSLENLLCSAKTLKFLYLSYNPFWGMFPDHFMSFSSLIELEIDHTNMSGSLPKNLGQQPKLEKLSLMSNRLSGLLPNFTGLSALKTLSLGDNQLNGSIPESLGQLSNLERLSLSGNFLYGVITEAQLSNLTQLEFLDISYNSVSMSLSPDRNPPIDLKYMYISSCNMGPAFPKWLQTQRRVELLKMAGANIVDSIPNWFWIPASTLETLDLSFNQIHGQLPNLSFNIHLFDIDLSSNQLSGPLPPFPPNIGYLILANNTFSGPITSLCSMRLSKLSVLDLSHNKLSGELPDCWTQFKNLEVLNLQNNSFSGKLPSSLGYLTKLTILHLSANNFWGEMPSLQNCGWLALLDIGGNRISGTIPEWLMQGQEYLSVLLLYSNEFRGSIPTTLCSLQSLQVLDLSQNKLSGVLPWCLNNITAMTTEVILSYADYVKMEWKGAERVFEAHLDLMSSFDVSGNHLSGEIPRSIANLSKLKSLNLSSNSFTGRIPSEVGLMDDLESLDLSRNRLSGTIPSSFSSFHSLAFLNLSYNKLTGKIPSGPQLQTFDASSYVGNEGLFGPPLTKDYGNRKETDQDSSAFISHPEEDHEDKYVTFGFYVSLVIGFVVGFWGFCGTLLFQSSWRHAYFRFWNNTKDWFYVTTRVFKARLLRRLTSDNN